MKLHHFEVPVTLALAIGFSFTTSSWAAQQPSSATVPVTVVVSVEAKHGKDIPAVTREDVRVFQGRDRLRVTDWIPLQGSQSGLELLILIDEGSGLDVASQFGDIRNFVNAQPNTTAIAIGYMQNGSVRMTQNFTTDHAAVGKALQIPAGPGFSGNSPYLSITDAIKHWQDSANRRAIFMISDGVDPLQPGATDSYLDAAAAQAQRAGVQVCAIYASGGGHSGHTLWRVNRGQSNLSELADDTGGEGYFSGLETPVAFAPFLNQFGDRLKHQYKLTFLAIPDKKDSYQHVRLETEVPNAELVTADKVYVPAAK
jgi:hypothetical protein